MLIALITVLLQAGPKPSVPVIDDTVRIEGAGTRLFLELKGRGDSSPILLHLHGGPGNGSALVLFRAYAGPRLESQALVGYLHQRGVLRSPAVPDSALTIANHVADVARAVAYLARRFPGRPIFLLGHSWGGLLATLVAIHHPEHLAGIVSASGVFDMAVTERASYDETLAWAKRTHTVEAVQKLTALGPPPYTSLDQQIGLSEWASNGNGGIAEHLQPAIAFGRPPYLAPDPGWNDVQLEISRAMLRELFTVRTSDRVAAVHLPLLVIVGSRDLVAPRSAIRDGFAHWGGPKTLVEMTGSHHLPFVDEPTRFVATVMAFVRGQ